MAPATKGGALFPRPKGGWPVSPGQSPVVKVFFILRRRRHHNPHGLKDRVKLSNPQAAGLSNLGPKGRQPSCPKGRVPVFPRAKPGCKGFIHTGGKAAHHNPQRQSRCQTLAPLEPSARRAVNPYARQGVSLKPQTPAGIRHSAPPAAGRPPSLPQKKWSHALCTAPLYYIL